MPDGGHLFGLREEFYKEPPAPWPVVLLQAGVPEEEESPVAEAEDDLGCPLPPQPEDKPGRMGEAEPWVLEKIQAEQA